MFADKPGDLGKKETNQTEHAFKKKDRIYPE
jgi:hypothetical protein